MAALNAEIPDDLKQQLDVKCAERRLSIREATTQAIEKWLDPDEGGDEREDPLISKLRAFLAGRDEEAIGLIRQGLEFFCSREVRSPKKSAVKRRRAG